MLLFALFISPIFSQTNTYQFTYDASGNRTKRVFLTLKSTEDLNIHPHQFNDDIVQYLKFDLYPNPTQSQIVLHISPFDSEIKGNITIIGIDGRIIYNSKDLVEENFIDLGSFNDGEYILKLVFGEISRDFKIIKR